MFSFGGSSKKSKESKMAEDNKAESTSNSNNSQLTDEAKQELLEQRQRQSLLKERQDELDQQLILLEAQLRAAREQIHHEKAGKRKIFHSLVKVANELKKTRQESGPIMEANEYANQPWYQGGIWRNQVQVLPGVAATRQSHQQRGGQAVSLSDLFLDLVIVTAFTRVGQAISSNQTINLASVLYFAVFWTIWSKEASYSSRFDTSDLSAKVSTLVTCFAVLFGSLSASAPLDATGATRIMMVGAFCAILNCLLHVRIAVFFGEAAPVENIMMGSAEPKSRQSVARVTETRQHVRSYAIFNIAMTLMEAIVWIIGVLVVPETSPLRWLIFAAGIILAMRVPRAFLANDFHAARSKRGVLFILLLGFLMQSVIVVASEFFQYDSPTGPDYTFIGASCLILFCIKLLYVEDSNTSNSQDHALLVNRTAAFLFNLGHFCLLFSTTVMGSGLNLVTHEYLAAAAALPGPSKQMVMGGFSAVVLSNYFIKSMHVKRVPSYDNITHRRMFIMAYVAELIVTLVIVIVTAMVCSGTGGGYLQTLSENDLELLFLLSGLALFLVLISWLDQGVELTLYDSAEDSQEYLIQPFGLWSFCLESEVTDEAMLEDLVADDMTLSRRLSAVSPLLGSSSAAFLKQELKNTEGYGSMAGISEEQV
ncbi:expressed unknown protein [Seminavis robusta]|uniref:Uncharacterized protein n=1 Tax=Seminavis robusta TaxID=568900 RepID=A0A9N8F356_9STRA|nr:expressed unknown protein [Seminavis robusta]|eukprot:Sro3000_g341930.1 n/a (651) ;mRNA; f:2560-4704